MLNITGRVDKVRISIYASSRILIGSNEEENPEHFDCALPDKLGIGNRAHHYRVDIVLKGLPQKMSSGLYHYVIETEGKGESDRAVGSFMVIK